MHKLLQALARRLMPLLLMAAAVGAAAAPVYRAHVVAAPYRLGGVEYFWYTAMGLNNQGKSLLTSYQYGSYGIGYVVHDKEGQYLRHVGGMSRYGGNLVQAINNHGDVAGHEWAGYYWVGQVQKDQGFDATVHGFPEGDFGGYFSDAYAYGLSDAGHVVGQAVGALDGRQRAYVWYLGTMQEIGTFGGATSTAVDVSDQGIAVGQADLADGSVHAFAFRGGALHDLGTLGGANSWARAINDRGQIAGTAETADGSLRAFVYEKRQMRALPTPEGANASAWSINRQGQVVGSYTLGGQGHAFLFDGGTVHRVQDLLRPVDQAVWTVAGAAAINDKGWILVDAHKAGDLNSTVLLLKPVR
jgi:probable HAF family extracellular repeat protein